MELQSVTMIRLSLLAILVNILNRPWNLNVLFIGPCSMFKVNFVNLIKSIIIIKSHTSSWIII